MTVLRDLRYVPINRRELARAKTTLLTRHESDLKDNTYWLGLITHLQVRGGRDGWMARDAVLLERCGSDSGLVFGV